MTSLNEWIDTKIKDGNIDYVEYNEFSDVKKIGEGGFGIVESAYWENCGIKIALKTLINNSSVDENSMNEFVKELKNLKKVSFHPNINRFYGISKEPSLNKYAIVLEFANQGNLREYLEIHFNDLQWDDKIRMVLDIVCGLKCLHFNEIIHRDLHAKNILVNNHILMIADFGTSKQLSEATSTSTNSKADEIGLIEYMEPQRFKNIKYKKTKKSDIYSLGVLLWEISSGRPPFSGYPQSDRYLIGFHIGYSNLREKPVDGTPQEYRELYQKCWDDEPNLRPDIEKVHETLNKLNQLNQLKSEVTTQQSLQPDTNKMDNSKCDYNDDLNLSDSLNSSISSQPPSSSHKLNGFTEEPLKNFDADISLENCVESTHETINQLNSKASDCPNFKRSENEINEAKYVWTGYKLRIKNINNLKKICEKALDNISYEGEFTKQSFCIKSNKLDDIINNWKQRFYELGEELECWKNSDVGDEFTRILRPLYRGKIIKCVLLRICDRGEEENTLRCVNITRDISIKASKFIGPKKINETIKSYPEIMAALILSRKGELDIIWE
ncbi:kinase-like domain-containing protein [Rhizophagus clarus]|uniref:Kinase-like domain-containing protein n=1 Tax=Rhizophagus clarus TaxID=94130 RepID=A0A8H3L745_9GLOM|nr:kinase-like domain-containing protein [Rhizophagus clarus]